MWLVDLASEIFVVGSLCTINTEIYIFADDVLFYVSEVQKSLA